jgi:hypothetical protein
MRTKLLSSLLVSAALMAPGVALADGGADVCHGSGSGLNLFISGAVAKLFDNPGQAVQAAHEGITIHGYTLLGGIPGQVQDDPGDAKDVAQGENAFVKWVCATPAQPD